MTYDLVNYPAPWTKTLSNGIGVYLAGLGMTAHDASTDSAYGRAIARSDKELFIGANFVDEPNLNSGKNVMCFGLMNLLLVSTYSILGTVYRYVKSSSDTWTFANKMYGSRLAEAKFGTSISLNNNWEMLIGERSTSNAYYYRKSSTTGNWTLIQNITKTISIGGSFGISNAMCDNLIFIGSNEDYITNTAEGTYAPKAGCLKCMRSNINKVKLCQIMVCMQDCYLYIVEFGVKQDGVM